NGAVEVAQHVFGMPVRVGIPGEGLTGLADTVRKPQFAGATGLTLFGAHLAQQAGFAASFRKGAVGRVLEWLKEFF
ncbi:MAG: cell division protein FtsA, partial [Planctomycetaceae bacterium]